MRRHQLVIFAVLLVSAWAAVAYEAPQNRLGVLVSLGPETVMVAKAHKLVAQTPTEPAIACRTKDWQACNAHCGGIAFYCNRTETPVFLGCTPVCSWAVHVALTCGCP